MNIHADLTGIRQTAELLNYDPATGVFTRRCHTGSRWRAGQRAGGRDAKGYVILKVGGLVVKAHRLAWFMVHGELPGIIDHINGDPADNRITNLRAVNKSANCLNSWTARPTNKRSGLQGVSKVSGGSTLWVARVTRGGKRVHLGCFPTPEAAHAAYLAAKKLALAEALHAG